MVKCEKCGRDVSKPRRHKYRCPGKKGKKPKMPKRKAGTGITKKPGQVVIVGGNEEQRAIVKKELDKGELDE